MGGLYAQKLLPGKRRREQGTRRDRLYILDFEKFAELVFNLGNRTNRLLGNGFAQLPSNIRKNQDRQTSLSRIESIFAAQKQEGRRTAHIVVRARLFRKIITLEKAPIPTVPELIK